MPRENKKVLQKKLFCAAVEQKICWSKWSSISLHHFSPLFPLSLLGHAGCLEHSLPLVLLSCCKKMVHVPVGFVCGRIKFTGTAKRVSNPSRESSTRFCLCENPSDFFGRF